MLLRWLRATYPDQEIPQSTIDSITHSSWHSHGLVSEAFMKVAREQHARGVVDPDVQIALGVLFYTDGNYERAKDCFESALSLRPRVSVHQLTWSASRLMPNDIQDYLLWNRLGSSLSNGNQPEASLGAYREALNLRPTYTRAIYNVGVACAFALDSHRCRHVDL